MNFESALAQLETLWLQYGLNVLTAVGVLIFGWVAARLVRRGTLRLMQRTDMDVTLRRFLSSLAYFLVITLVVITALGRFVDTTSFTAVVAAAGIAIGLALQGSLANFASGIMLVFFRPFVVGNYVEAAGISGSVESINVFSTRLRTPDNKAVIVGNSEIYSSSITNYSSTGRRRIDLVIGIGYEDDIDHAREVLTRILRAEDRILDDPEPKILVLELAASTVDLAVRPWTKTEDHFATKCALLEEIKKTFDREGISLPYPQQDVHLRSPSAAHAAATQTMG